MIKRIKEFFFKLKWKIIYNEIEKVRIVLQRLIDAGYTKDDIEALINNGTEKGK